MVVLNIWRKLEWYFDLGKYDVLKFFLGVIICENNFEF